MLVLPATGLAFATKVTSRRPPQPELLVVVKGVYEIKAGEDLELLDRTECAPSGDEFDEGDDLRSGACLVASDFADAKLNAEVLVRGSFHAVGGRAVKESSVGFSVAGLSKRLRVVGRRAWVDDALGSAASDPLPFTTVPIDWANAYGGESFGQNPAGRGHVSAELPQVESFDAPVKKRGAHNVAASMGPISRTWPARAGKVGKAYGKPWQETRAPFVSEDFDWTYHHAAPADQQLAGYLRGDETIAFENMHPQHSKLEVRLPGRRVRGFARLRDGSFKPFALNLDTLTADLDKGRLSLVWRGHLAIREQDFADVRALMLLSEPLGGPQMSEKEAMARLDEFERDPVGVEAAHSAMLTEMAEGIPALPGEPPEQPDAIATTVTKGLPPELGKLSRNIAIILGETKQALAGGPADAEVEAKVAKALADATAAGDDEPPVPVTSKPGELPSMGARKIVRKTQEQLASAEQAMLAVELPEEQRKQQQAEVDKLRGVPHEPMWKQLDPEYSVPEPLSSDEPGPYANLIDRDFTGQDLSGLDLTGAKLDGAVLTRARLVGTKLREASLRGAVLFKTEAEGASFEGADFTRANCAKLQAKGANFRDANLELAFFEDAELEGAIFERTRATWTAFARANLSGVAGRACQFYRADLEEANLQRADLSGGSLRAAVLSRANAQGIDLTGTEVRAMSAANADLSSATLVRAYGERVNLVEATLDDADFSLAVLPKSHFTKATARRCEFWGANLADCRFYRSDISDSRFDRANLIAADLTRSKLDRAVFDQANLYDAKLYEAAGKDASFSGANLERCNYTQRRSEGS